MVFLDKNKKAIHLIKKIYPIEFQTIKYKKQLGAKLRKKFLKYYQISLEINLNSTRKKLKIFDLEALSLVLTAENLRFSSECQFFR